MRSEVSFSFSTRICVFAVSCFCPPALAVQSSPINAGCYIAAPGKCMIHVDPITIRVTSGQKLSSFKLLASGSPIYQFSTDISNPPAGNYSPSISAVDFAVTCGQSYVLALSARDSGDASFVQIGSTPSLTCPDGTGWLTWRPVANTRMGSSRTRGSATFRGLVNAQGGASQVTFEYGTTTAYGQQVAGTPTGFSDTTDRIVSAVVTGLDPTRLYHFRIVVQNSQKTVNNADQVIRPAGVSLAPILILLLH